MVERAGLTGACAITFLLDCGGFPRPTIVEVLVNEVLPALNEAGGWSATAMQSGEQGGSGGPTV